MVRNWDKKGTCTIRVESSMHRECLSLINNWMGTMGIHREAFEVGFKGWDWSMGSIQDPWNAGFHPREARLLVE